MINRDFITILRDNNFNAWAERVESGGADPIDALMHIAQYVGNKEVVLDLCCVISGRPEFFMVYREGGNSPKFKHDTRGSAELEAARIARESGNDTYVLAVVAKHEGRAMPTNEEVRKHAEALPCELSMNDHKWGLWRVVPGTGLPRLVAATPGYNDSPIFSDGVTCIRPPVGEWEPVTKSGDSIEDLPF